MEHNVVTQGLRVLTTKDIQDIFKIGKNSAYELMHSPAFPSFSINNRLYVTEEALADWLDTYKKKKFNI